MDSRPHASRSYTVARRPDIFLGELEDHRGLRQGVREAGRWDRRAEQEHNGTNEQDLLQRPDFEFAVPQFHARRTLFLEHGRFEPDDPDPWASLETAVYGDTPSRGSPMQRMHACDSKN